MRIYYYQGYIYELLTMADNNIEPEAGNPIMEAKSLSFEKEGEVIRISSVDANNLSNSATVAIRSGSGVAS